MKKITLLNQTLIKPESVSWVEIKHATDYYGSCKKILCWYLKNTAFCSHTCLTGKQVVKGQRNVLEIFSTDMNERIMTV